MNEIFRQTFSSSSFFEPGRNNKSPRFQLFEELLLHERKKAELETNFQWHPLPCMLVDFLGHTSAAAHGDASWVWKVSVLFPSLSDSGHIALLFIPYICFFLS